MRMLETVVDWMWMASAKAEGETNTKDARTTAGARFIVRSRRAMLHALQKLLEVIEPRPRRQLAAQPPVGERHAAALDQLADLDAVGGAQELGQLAAGHCEEQRVVLAAR